MSALSSMPKGNDGGKVHPWHLPTVASAVALVAGLWGSWESLIGRSYDAVIVSAGSDRASASGDYHSLNEPGMSGLTVVLIVFVLSGLVLAVVGAVLEQRRVRIGPWLVLAGALPAVAVARMSFTLAAFGWAGMIAVLAAAMAFARYRA